MRLFFILLFLVGNISVVWGQPVPNFWLRMTPDAGFRQEAPTYELNEKAFRATLWQAPMEFSQTTALPLLLPDAEGNFIAFQLVESPVMHPDLHAKYPEIKTFTGISAEGWRVHLGWGYAGLYAFMTSPTGAMQEIERVASAQYRVYRYEDRPRPPVRWGEHILCGTEHADHDFSPFFTENPALPAQQRGAGASIRLKKYRLAVAAQGEYSLFHGGTKPLVLSEIVKMTHFIVGIFERDFAIRLELVPNNDTLIFLNPDTDPYIGSGISQWKDQNVQVVNSLIGSNNYDFGHVVARILNPPLGVYVAGQAALSCVCNQNKAQAGSSLPQPTGADFYLIVAHEMGHQLSATHTFNSCPPSADARTSATAYEPGGGSTVMSYAGVCAPDVVQNNSDAYFHVANLIQVKQFLETGSGKTCGQNIDIGNTAPVVNIPIPAGLTLPKGTPFTLTAQATDAQNTPLTYCWEQFDLGSEVSLGSQSASAPLFRSFSPVSQPSRNFPRLLNLIINQNNPTETLPQNSRELNFRCTVRDNHVGGGGWASELFTCRSTDRAGPFVVTSPNVAADRWVSGSFAVVTWEVANTDLPPVNCKKVNILLSTDAGQNFNIVLATDLPNTGKACVVVPNLTSSAARVQVRAADHIFFDISNANFRIESPTTPGFSVCTDVLEAQICTPQKLISTISTVGMAGFTDNIELKINNLPAGATYSCSPPTVQPGQSAVLEIEFSPAVAEATYDLELVGTAGAASATRVLRLTVVNNDFSQLVLQTPTDGETGVGQSPTLTWKTVPDANLYDVEVATNPNFLSSNIVQSARDVSVGNFKIPVVLEKGRVYFWRVRPSNECGAGEWSEAFSFSTLKESCQTYLALDLPKNLSANGTPTLEIKIKVPDVGKVTDVNVSRLQGSHQSFRQLDVSLVSPAGTNVLLFKGRCGSVSVPFTLNIDDAASGFPCPPPNTTTQPVKPTGLLTTFNGEEMSGDWNLIVKDTEAGSGGTIQAVSLELCSASALAAPFIVKNEQLTVQPAANALISNDLLKVEHPNKLPTQLIYIIVRAPQTGDLRINGFSQREGASFTQADIDAGRLRYYDYKGKPEHFRFVVIDLDGGMVAGRFNIQPFPVQSDEATDEPLDFQLAPNPSRNDVWLYFSKPLDHPTEIRLVGASGQLLNIWQLERGSRQVRLETAHLPAGVYVVFLHNAIGVRAMGKLVKPW